MVAGRCSLVASSDVTPMAHATVTHHRQTQINQQVTTLGVITREFVTLGEQRYRASPPLSFVLTEHSGMYHLEGDFDICLTYESSAELKTVLLDEALEFIWEEYALEADANLDEGARRLRTELRSRLEPQPDGLAPPSTSARDPSCHP